MTGRDFPFSINYFPTLFCRYVIGCYHPVASGQSHSLDQRFQRVISKPFHISVRRFGGLFPFLQICTCLHKVSIAQWRRMRSRRLPEYVCFGGCCRAERSSLTHPFQLAYIGRPERWSVCGDDIRSSRRRAPFTPLETPPSFLLMFSKCACVLTARSHQPSWGQKRWVSAGTKPSSAAFVSHSLSFIIIIIKTSHHRIAIAGYGLFTYTRNWQRTMHPHTRMSI